MTGCQQKMKSYYNLSVRRNLKKRNEPPKYLVFMAQYTCSFFILCTQCVIYDLSKMNRAIELQNKIEDLSRGNDNYNHFFLSDLIGDDNGELTKTFKLKITCFVLSYFSMESKKGNIELDFENKYQTMTAVRAGGLADDKDSSILLIPKKYHGLMVWPNQSRRSIPDLYRSIDLEQKPVHRTSQLVTHSINVMEWSSIIIQSVYRGFRARRHLEDICSKNFVYVDSELDGIFSDEADCLLNGMLDKDANLESLTTVDDFLDDNKVEEKIFRSSDEAEFSLNTSSKQNFFGETTNTIHEKRRESPINDMDQHPCVGDLKKDVNNRIGNTDSIMKEWNLNTSKVAEVSFFNFSFDDRMMCTVQIFF